MYQSLIEYGCEDVSYRTPKRFTEGYGISKGMIEEIPENSLIITVDNGIAAHEAIDYAKSRGCTIIVTDHHEPVKENGIEVLPNADLIIDPKCSATVSTYDGYCGAGIAYKIAIFLNGESVFKKYMPMAAITTNADGKEASDRKSVV
jgi:Single-stranded DNA-specific exonuclease